MKRTQSALMLAALVGSMAGLTGIVPGQFNGTSAKAQPNTNAHSGERNTGSRGGFFSQDAARLNFGREPNPQTRNRRRGPGWTNAHAKRVSRKARNVKRHRAVMKRSK